MGKVVFSLIIVLGLVATACSPVANVPALQQEGDTWPRCISGCTAKDVVINRVWLDVSAGNYTLGEIVTHNVSMNLYLKRQNTYCIVVVADLYEGGVVQQTDWVSSIIGYHGGSGNYTYPMGTVNWTYGKLFEMRNVLVMWVQNAPKGGGVDCPPECTCPTDCTEYTAPSKCNHVATFIVTTPLVVDFEFDEVCFCSNTTFIDGTTGGVKPYTWYWDFDDGDSSTAQNATHHFDSAGNYTVTLNVTDSDSPPTTASQSYNVTVSPNPTVNIAPDGGELTCATTFIILTADTTGSACTVTSYQWYDGDSSTGTPVGTNSSTYSTNSPGLYTCVVTCTNGCYAEDSITVNQDIDAPVVDVTKDGDLSCTVTSVLLTAVTAGTTCTIDSYQWYDGDSSTGTPVGTNSSTYSTNSPGLYTCVATCTNGCYAEDSITVSQDIDAPVADFNASDTNPCVNEEIDFFDDSTGTYDSWSWDVDGDGTEDYSIQNPSHTYTGAGTYTVSLTVSNGCGSDTETKTVTVTECCCICGFVYRYGTMEPLTDWEVRLEKQTNPWIPAGNTTTDANGMYCFCGLVAGNYRVYEVVQPGWSQVSPLPNEHFVTLLGDCCDPAIGLFRDFDFRNQQGPAGSTVGYEASSVDKLAVLAPWIALLLAAIVGGTSFLVLRRRRA